jgi:hypothetical protein
LSELRASDMGEDKIRYLLPVSGRCAGVRHAPCALEDSS